MSLLQFASARSVRHQAQPQTSITAAVRSRNVTGTGLVSGGIVLQRGQLTPAMLASRQFSVFVAGVEKSCGVVALRGLFPDGSIRSVLVQFQHNVPDTTTDITAEIVLGRVRQTSDISVQPVTAAVITAKRVIVVTDVGHLCASFATFQPLLAEASLTGQNASMYGTFFTSRFNSIKNVDLTNGNYQSTYESSRGLLAKYCMTGTHEFYDQAIERAYYLMIGYSLPSTSFTPITPHPNENALPGVFADGTPGEPHSQRYLNYACAYLFTGCVEFWNCCCVYGIATMNGRSTLALAEGNNGWVHSNFIGRFNIMGAWASALSIVMDCTKLYSYPGKWGGARRPAYTSELPWLLSAWQTHRFQTGDFRVGLRGSRSTAADSGKVNPGRVPHFHYALDCDFLLFWYFNMQADATVAGYIRDIVDVIWDNSIVNTQSGDQGFPTAPKGYGYMQTEVAGQRTGVEPDFIWGVDPWTIVMFAPAIAFCKAFYGTAKYTTNLAIATNTNQVAPSHLTWSWKIFGESYGNTMCTPYLDQVGLPGGLPSAMRTPVLY